MKKNNKIVIKRLIYAVLLFFVMPIVNIVFSAFDNSGQKDLVEANGVNYLSCWNNAKSAKKIDKFKIVANFDGNGGTVQGDKNKSCGGSVSCKIITPLASRNNYTFLGWSDDDCVSYKKGSLIIYKNLENKYKACWEENPDSSNNNNNNNNSVVPDNIEVDDTNKIKYVTYSRNIANYSRKVGFYQAANQSRWGDSCLGFSQAISDAIVNKDTKVIDKNKTSLYGNSPSVSHSFSNKSYNSKKEMLTKVYDELSKGKPCVIHVNGRKSGSAVQSRHYVVAIGYKKAVTSKDNLEDTDLFIIDPWDSKVENVGFEGSGNRFIIPGTKCSYSYGYQIYTIN